ncbi:hypothetical protein NEF87_004049 [Candidatus Lokiarchaeum ossiferum]|uniref:tRNA (adenine(58)-N(1))-methyltransferase catalytic subunit TRM61 C-terminal domain-containing protein n=1 Tax=Candidatus Lokiarchaeum ossiferum TaxID=2951803 RepID=A0ABY6HYX8_9ARCH|nr:hypothetical protein NEF87_004049 [Candidatus Lokiarchaeum sp. B-35]
MIFATLHLLMTVIQDGDLIFIVHDKRRQWVRKVQAKQQFHCDRGFLRYDDIIGKPFGETFLLQPNNHKVALLNPLPGDIISHMKRQSQIIYPEDIGLILTSSGIHLGSKVIEAGTGSGTVSSVLGMFCGKTGKVNTFDIREIALDQARKNIAQMGADGVVSAQFGNIIEDNFEFSNIDFAMLDLATTWLAVPKVLPYLSDNARICLFSPTLEQVKKNNQVLGEYNFNNIITIEMMKRTFQVKPNATRPHGRMIGHTGYLTFANRDTNSLYSSAFSEYITPENLGNLFVYGGIVPGIKLLVVSSEKSSLVELIKYYFKEGVEFIKIPKTYPPNEVSTFIKSACKVFSTNSFNSILIDNLSLPDLVSVLHPLLLPGGAMCALSAYVENMKMIFDQLMELKYFELTSSELIKRQILVENDGSSTHSSLLPSTGYITVGRKVIDKHPYKAKPVPKNEFVDIAVEVGLNLKETLPEEKEKVDYANLRE